MSKYFRDTPRIDVSGIMAGVEADMQLNDAELNERLVSTGVTQEYLLRLVERMEADHGGRVSWDMSCSLEEFIRKVKSGEVVFDES